MGAVRVFVPSDPGNFSAATNVGSVHTCSVRCQRLPVTTEHEPISIDRTENISLNDLFERMSVSQLEIYARDGTLPGWFSEQRGFSTATVNNGNGGKND